jgi:SecD/SecF fusion protein
MSDRQRHGFILLIVIGLIAASGVAIAVKKTVLGLDLKGGIELVYQASGTAQQPLTSTTLNEAVQSMEKRVNALGLTEPSIQTEGKNLIDVQLPNASNVASAEKSVGETTRLAFYDWEARTVVSVVGGKPKFAADGLVAQDPTSETISQGGGQSSTSSGGMGLHAAVLLASKLPAQTFKSKTGGNSRKGPEYFLFGAPKSAACAALAASEKVKPTAGAWCLLTGAPVQLTAGQKLGTAINEAVDQTVGHGLSPAQLKGTQQLKVNQGWIVVQGATTTGKLTSNPWLSTAQYYVLEDDAALFGNSLTNPQEISDSGQPAVSFSFNSAGGKAFQKVTETIARRGSLDSVGATSEPQHFAAILGTQILTVPSIATKYVDGLDPSQGSEISGSFTTASADQLASYLRLGSLPVNLREISDNPVSASLGSQSLHQGVVAGIIGLLVVVLFLIAYYRILGLVAVCGLVAYGVYFFALIKLIPITLTLAGMAGLVLTIGVAADANIVIFERVKEEIRAGRTVRNGIIEGYKKGLSAIIDANVVTIMTAFVLFVLSTADVKGFAFTLGVGTIVSLFTAVMATQAILMSVGDSSTMARPSALGVGKKRRRWTFDFMGASRYFFTLSGVILLIGGFAIGGRGLNLGIDFTSGSQIQVGLTHKATTAEVKSVMASIGEGDATVQAVSGNKALGKNGFQIQAKFLSQSKLDTLRNDLQNKFGLLTSKSGSQDFDGTTIGPTFGSAVTHSAVVAVVIALLVISVYVALRFDWKYAVPVLIALAHDLLISIGVYALTGREVTANTVAALLTILGYSMYDTIIVFDRVRENTKRMPNATMSQILNRSMSEVLTRSLATTACTLLPVIALLLFGGSTLKDFAFALLVGVASGAYSSIFIASPVLMHWKEREHGFRLRRQRIIAEHGFVPAYAAGAGADIDPDRKNKGRSGRLTAPDPDGVSAREFEEMKRELGLEEETEPTGRTSALTRRTTGASAPGTTGGARAGNGRQTRPGGGGQRPAGRPPQPGKPTQPSQPPAPPTRPAADAAGTEPVPESQQFEHEADVNTDDAVLPNQPRPAGGARPRGGNRNKKHGRR